MYSDYLMAVMGAERRREALEDMRRIRLARKVQANAHSASPIKDLTHSVSQQWGHWFHVQPATRA